MSPRDSSKPASRHAGERLYEVRAVDGFCVPMRGSQCAREDGFLVVRNAEGVIVYAAPESRVADVTPGPEAATPPPKPRVAPAGDAPSEPERPKAAIRPRKAQPTPAEVEEEGEGPNGASAENGDPGGDNGGLKRAARQRHLNLPREADAKAAGYLRVELDAQRAAKLEERLVAAAQEAGYTVAALYRDEPDAPTSPEDAPGLGKLLEDAREGFFATVLLCAPASSARDIARIGELSTLLGGSGLRLMVVGHNGVPQPG